ncbi:MAG: DUF2336 domain-containing protein [Rhodospirillales bacterium]
MNENNQNGEPTVDHEFLLNLAREKSTMGRAKLTETITDLFENKGDALTDRERALMFGILRSVVREIEMSVRRGVAQQLAGLNDVPEDLVRILANDEIEVAYPVLTESGLLKDSDLIEIIRHRTMEHQLAVAIRQNISEEVSQALVETGNERVVVTLLKNENAKISQSTMEYLVEQSKRVDTFQEPVLHREELRPDLAQRMFMWVSAALREFIIENFKLDQSVVDDLLEQIAAKESGVVPDVSTSLKSNELAANLEREGMVTPEMLITALSQGEVSLFLALFSRLTGIREYLAKRILFEPGGEGLAICCKAVGLTKEEFAQIFRYAQLVRARRSDRIEEALTEVIWIYEDMSREAAAGVLKTWRRNTGYLSAIRQIQSATRRNA